MRIDPAELAEVAQEQLGQGPCMAAFTQGLPVAIPDLGADARFDQIVLAMHSAGIRAALSVPVEVGGGPIGTLDLFTATPRAWDESEVAAAHAYAGVVASLLGSAVAAHASTRLANQLQVALDSRVLIEQAKGVLMAFDKVDAQTAFTRLRRMARSTSRPLLEVARKVIDGVWRSPNNHRPPKAGRGKEFAQEH